MIVNDNSRVVNKLLTSPTDDARVVIYDHHMFIVQATYVRLVACTVNIWWLQMTIIMSDACAINDASRVVKMMIIGDATTWNITSDDSGVSYDHNIFIIQTLGCKGM
jgi:hypothetical protein